MVEQKREGRNVVTRCPNMDMFRRESARRRENEGSDKATRDCRNRSSTPSRQLSRVNLQYYCIRWQCTRMKPHTRNDGVKKPDYSGPLSPGACMMSVTFAMSHMVISG